MKLYYHQTDGKAEYYCLTPVKGTDEGNATSWVLRTDGNEFELNTNNLAEAGIRVIIK